MRFKVDVKIHAILFSVDERVFDINLHSGYGIAKKSLHPTMDHLEREYGLNHEELRRQYDSAVIDESLNVPCAYKEIQLDYNENSIDDVIRKVNNQITEELNGLDRQLRLIRLLTECAISFKVFRFVGEIYYNDDSALPKWRRYGPLSCSSPIPEAYARTTEYKTIWDSGSIAVINNVLFESLPSDEVWSPAFGLYDASYFQLNNPNSNANALLLLMICLEMMFLDKKDSKVNPLSKRCAIYIGSSVEDRINIYNGIKSMYKLRSDYVHDGNLDATGDDVRKLREYVRLALQKYKQEKRSKGQMIEDMKAEVAKCEYFR